MCIYIYIYILNKGDDELNQLALKIFPLEPMFGKKRWLVADELVEFEKNWSKFKTSGHLL